MLVCDAAVKGHENARVDHVAPGQHGSARGRAHGRRVIAHKPCARGSERINVGRGDLRAAVEGNVVTVAQRLGRWIGCVLGSGARAFF